ncbi:MAG: tetratricopeptide repeat protein [Bacteroidaceae bacterium]|nr:tetratricopeptide repeat protein [Bacteroidaceae bacterium]
MEVNIPDLITHPEKLADRQLLQQLQTLSAKYPYYQTLYLLYLKGLYLLHDTRFGEELRRASLFVANRKVLFSLIEGDYYTLKPIVRKAKLQEKNNNQPVDRTLSLIDAFLNGLPPEPLEEEPFNDERLSNDYTTYVLREEDFDNQENEQGTSTPVTPAIPMKGQELIDQFIKKADREVEGNVQNKEIDTPVPDLSNNSEEEDEENYFTETLAKIYIKQHRYSKALEIIRRLSLKYPKKNAYFADQIRFLEKLIINDNDK